MLSELIIASQEKIEKWNKGIEEQKLIFPGLKWDRHKVECIDDQFKPYKDWLGLFKGWNSTKNPSLNIITDENIDFSGVFLTNSNPNHTIKLLTDAKIVKDDNGFEFVDYGVCDNASQAIRYYESQVESGKIKANAKHIICLQVQAKYCQPEFNGWRWHKHGTYIGVQNPQCEYLYDEDTIDLVYCFCIIELEL